MSDVALKLFHIPDRLRESLGKLSASQEAAERLKSEAAFVKKFGKLMSTGIPITVQSGKEIIERLVSMKDGLSPDCAVCRVHTPKVVKPP